MSNITAHEQKLAHGHYWLGSRDVSVIDGEYVLLEIQPNNEEYQEIGHAHMLQDLLTTHKIDLSTWAYADGVWETKVM